MTNYAKHETKKNAKVAMDTLKYDFATGDVIRVKAGRTQQRRVGKSACSVYVAASGNKYFTVQINSRNYKAHRVAWLLHYGSWPKNDIDHIDGNGWNNRMDNLRDVERRENTKNAKMYRNNKSGVTGVTWVDRINKWVAGIRINGKRIHLGSFSDLADAADCRRNASVQYGFHTNHGSVR